MKKSLSILLLVLVAACSPAPEVATPTQSPPPTVTVTVPATSTPTATLWITPTPPAVVINSGDWIQPYVALTFDMCQDPLYPADFDAAVVNVLQQSETPATFFMGGDWMRTHPEETKLLAANPNFELGNHSWSHPDFTQLSEEEIGQEIDQTEDMLFQITGRHSRLFRLPSGLYNEQILRIIASH